MTHYHIFETRLGFCGIAWAEGGITRFRLPYTAHEEAERQFAGKATASAPTAHVASVVDMARRYFAGERIDFSAIGLDLTAVDPPRRVIYDALRRDPDNRELLNILRDVQAKQLKLIDAVFAPQVNAI